MSESEKRSSFPEVELELEVKDKDGKVIQKHKQKARSWVKNFILFLRYAFAGSNIPLVKQDGTVTTFSIGTSVGNMMSVDAGNGNTIYGIFVGSGTNPYSINDYALQSKITTGGFQYGATAVEDLTDTGSSLYFGIARTFLNGTGNPVTVSEVGLVMNANGVAILIARDLLSTPVTIPVGATLTVRYVITYRYA